MKSEVLLLESISASQCVGLNQFVQQPLQVMASAGDVPVAVLSNDRVGFYVLSVQAMQTLQKGFSSGLVRTESVLAALDADVPEVVLAGDSFECLAQALLAQVRSRVLRGEVTQKTCDVTRNRLDGQVLPFFGERRPSGVCEADVEEFLSALTKQGLSRGTLFQYLLLLRKLLELAVRQGLRVELPAFPCLRVVHKPRAMLSVREYREMVRTAYRLHRSGVLAPEVKRSQARSAKFWIGQNQRVLPRDMAWMMVFMVNTFMRPSDLRNLQHKHVDVVRSGQQVYLRLRLPQSKRHDTPIVSLRPAVRVYEALKRSASSVGQARPEDFVFLPGERNRGRALALMGFWFAWVMREAGVESINEVGAVRTIYSLRHTAIMFRLMYGQGIDMLTLARNARTSVRMIEHFYASSLSGELNVAMLQSRRTPRA